MEVFVYTPTLLTPLFLAPLFLAPLFLAPLFLAPLAFWSKRFWTTEETQVDKTSQLIYHLDLTYDGQPFIKSGVGNWPYNHRSNQPSFRQWCSASPAAANDGSLHKACWER